MDEPQSHLPTTASQDGPAPVPPPLPRMFLARDPDVLVARVAQGLTLYLAEPLHWGREGAGRALEAFFAAAPRGSLVWSAVSTRVGWHELGRGDFERLARHVSVADMPRPRHGFRVRFADDPEVPSVQFDYREVDPERESRAAVLELTLPQDHPPQILEHLLGDLVGQGPIWSAVGGYVGRWNERQKSAAFWQLFRWARRHLGLDLQDADATSWRAALGLPSTNWLTFVGTPLAENKKVDLVGLAAGATNASGASSVGAVVTTESHERGQLWRAGELLRGDVNYFQVPTAYATVARALEPLLDPAPARLWSGFWEGDRTKAWQRRFLEPEVWQG